MVFNGTADVTYQIFLKFGSREKLNIYTYGEKNQFPTKRLQ